MQALALVLKAYCFLISILHKAYSGGMIILPPPPKKKNLKFFLMLLICVLARENQWEHLWL